jgi:hypothetical protein
MKKPKPTIYGLLAEFTEPEVLLDGARRAYTEGYRKLDAYSPYPIEDLAEAIGFTHNRMPTIVLIGGICGALLALTMQWFSAVIHYPLNVGGRPLFSWPAFVPITFELTILLGAFSAVIGMLGLNGLPMPYHPLFHVPNFAMASRNRFFLCIQADDPKFDLAETQRFLESLGAKKVCEVPH